VTSLKPVEATIIPDRIEAGTFMIGAGMTGGEINIYGCNQQHLEALINKLRDTGMKITPIKNGLKAVGPKKIHSVDIKTLPHPGFPTDLQAQMMAYMSVGSGLSVISETVFENRFMHVSELMRMGADINIQGGSAIVRGVLELRGAQTMATDLRASASLLLAALVAKGTTEISRVYHIDRGYQEIEKKFSALGADIKRIKQS
jgi:UDP-N-acetylglucosamine 1-carboxyvinyltransferase